MATIVIYDPTNVIVANRVTQYLTSVNTPDYDSETNKLVNPDLSAVEGISLVHWKVDTGEVVEMSVPEKAIIDQSIQDLNTLNAANIQRVEVKEEFTQTGGHYQGRSYVLSVPAEIGEHTLDITFPVPVSLLCVQMYIESSMNGDEGKFCAAPDTIIGAITQNVAIDDTVINVSQTVLDNTALGYAIKLDNATDTDELGVVTEIDGENSTITVQTAATKAFLAATPTYVKQTVEMFAFMRMQAGRQIEYGRSRIGGSHIAVGRSLRLIYNNVSGTAKEFVLDLEYLY